MPTQRPDSFVIIAPRGAEYSSMSDEDFAAKTNPTYYTTIELTLQQYAAWVITADTLLGKFEQDDGEGMQYSTSLTIRRIAEHFPGMAPGQFNAERPFTSRFRATDEEIGPVGSEGRFFRFLLSNVAFFEIEQIYHRDKFYLTYSEVSSGPESGSGEKEIIMTPTSITRISTGNVYSYTLGEVYP